MEKRLKILLADDDEDDRDLFIDAIKEIDDKNIEVYTASDGQEALDFLHDKNNSLPDYIFLDLRMPKTSGRICLQTIKQDQRLKNIPVFIYTTSNDVEDSKSLADLGATHFISKPSNPEEIYYLLSQAINESWA